MGQQGVGALQFLVTQQQALDALGTVDAWPFLLSPQLSAKAA